MRTPILVVLLMVLSFSGRGQVLEYRGLVHGASIGKFLELYRDTTAQLTSSQVLASARFVRSEEDVPNLGITSNNTWFRLNLRNGTSESSLALIIPYADIDLIQLFDVTGGTPVLLDESGQTRNRLGVTKGGEYMFTLPIRPEENKTYLFSISGHKHMHVPVFVETPIGMLDRSILRSLVIGSFIGLMLVLVLYNLFLYTATKDPSYLTYVFYIGINSIAQLTLTGTAQEYLWRDNALLTEHGSVLAVLMSICTGILFTQQFIGSKKYSPRLDRLAPIGFTLSMIAGVLYLFIDTNAGYKMAQAISGLSAVYLMSLAISSMRSGSRPAKFFLVAWSFFLCGVLLFLLKDSGIIPYTDLTVMSMPVGSAIEGILLSFGLADRINVLRREKAASQAAELRSSQENERIIREQNVTLEKKVNERTHALQESNAHLKQTQTKLVNAEKMASLGQLTAGIAHEINNPINFITSNIQPLRRNIAEIVEVMQGYRSIEASKAKEQMAALKLREEELGISESINELDEIIGSMAEGSSRTAEIVRGLRNFSRLDEDDLKPTDLNEGIRSTLTLLGPQVKDHVTITLDLMELPSVECYPGKLNQVFMNVITNAIHATKAMSGDRKPLIQISSHCTSGHAVICIRDNGTGMNAEVKTRIFDPFFTTKPVGEGTGLGLAIVYGIIEDHHGSITVESEVGEGSVFTIQIPLLHEKLIQLRA